MTLTDEARKYQWYTGYSRSDEYQKCPQWASDMRVEEDSATVKIYDRFGPDEAWIKTDTTCNLMQMI